MNIPLPWLKEYVDADLPVGVPLDRPAFPSIGPGGVGKVGGVLGIDDIRRLHGNGSRHPAQF